MELNIEVVTSDSCKVIVKDLSKYLPEDQSGIVKGKFKFSDTVSIDVLQHNKSQETIYRDPVYSLHTANNPIQIPVTFDGWFTVIHVVLPSKEWFDKELSKQEGSAIGIYSLVYFSDGASVYKYVDGHTEETTIEEILEVNPVNTTISKTEKDYVSICFLRKCYINLCQQIFNNRGFSSCWKKNEIDSDLLYRRDLVWMAINVIKYLTECEQLAEVERIIETINGCNGLCATSDITSKTSGCGCGKHT